MISKVIKDKIDIDKILIVTFTNAAASEMRERILDAIYKQIDENPEDEALQKQIILLNKASICTIHSFCLDVIRNHFYELDIPANFRVGDTGEIELLKQDVIEELFEEKYLNNDKEFIKLINTYTNYRDDESLKELIITIYKFIQSSPFPKEWIEEKVKMFKIDDITDDFSGTIWGKILLESLSEDVKDCIIRLENLAKEMKKFDELEKYIKVIQNDTYELQSLLNNLNTWDSAYNHSNIEWMKWPVDRKVTIELKDEAKKIRDDIKKKISSSINKVLLYNSEVANNDIKEMYSILNSLKNLILEFSDRFKYKKREKNIIDFNDIEHFALELLVKKDDKGNLISTEIANEYKEKFEEIAIDEYQDSNLVQEYILSSVSKGNNIFMVGDVKQSIYKFRQAMPELFLNKYHKYKSKKDKQKEDDLKIQLFKNFRSRDNVLDFTNIVFQDIMSNDLGDIEYDEKEYLNLGADYPELKQNFATEIDIIDLKEEEKQENIENEEIFEEKNEEEEERVENIELEARFVANRIKELIKEKFQVWDRKKSQYRNIEYKDIVILLRSTANIAPIYEQEILSLNMPVFSDSSQEYLGSIEIQTIMSLLKIIDNPMQDIPLVTVLRSFIGKFTDDELVQIRLSDKYDNFYVCMQKAMIDVNKELKEKICNFLSNLDKWRDEQEYFSLDELIWKIYIDTGFYNYVRINAKW